MTTMDIKSTLIGFLSCACLVLIMGQGGPTPPDPNQMMDMIKQGAEAWQHSGLMEMQTSKYQGFSSGNIAYMMDTRSAKLYVMEGDGYGSEAKWVEKISGLK